VRIGSLLANHSTHGEMESVSDFCTAVSNSLLESSAILTATLIGVVFETKFGLSSMSRGIDAGAVCAC
jgi:hypothetical protein